MEFHVFLSRGPEVIHHVCGLYHLTVHIVSTSVTSSPTKQGAMLT